MGLITKKKEKINFLRIFIGDYVVITTSLKYTKSALVETENGHEPVTYDDLLVYKGYFVDIDDEYVYLGAGDMKVSMAIRKEEVKAIEIEEIKSVEDELLDNMEVPDKEGVN